MSPKHILIAAALYAGLAAPALAQGAVRPVEALIVNPETRPVPVADKALANALQKLATAPAPYQHSIRFSPSPNLCTQFVCAVTFPAVPAGKRLVITHASARYAAPALNAFPSVELGDSSDGDVVLLPAPVGNAITGAQQTFIVSSPVTFHVEAGRAPVLSLQGIGVGATSNTATASVVGHLVDAN